MGRARSASTVAIRRLPQKQRTTLDRRLVRNGCNALRLVARRAHRARLPRRSRLPLQVQVHTLLLRLPFLGRVLLDADEELFS